MKFYDHMMPKLVIYMLCVLTCVFVCLVSYAIASVFVFGKILKPKSITLTQEIDFLKEILILFTSGIAVCQPEVDSPSWRNRFPTRFFSFLYSFSFLLLFLNCLKLFYTLVNILLSLSSSILPSTFLGNLPLLYYPLIFLHIPT